MLLLSPAFNHDGNIPAKFTCDGGNINPELQIENVPEGTRSLALIVDDPDAPNGTFTHWTVWNIDPRTTLIKEESTPPGAVEGKTSFGQSGYGGPCPPSGTHHYHFRLYALNTVLSLSPDASRQDLETAIAGCILAAADLVGLYHR